MNTKTKPANDIFEGIDGIVAAEHKQVVADLKKRLAQKNEQVSGLKKLVRSYQNELDLGRHKPAAIATDLGPAAEVFNFPPLPKPKPTKADSPTTKAYYEQYEYMWSKSEIEYCRERGLPNRYAYPVVSDEEDQFYRAQLYAEDLILNPEDYDQA